MYIYSMSFVNNIVYLFAAFMCSVGMKDGRVADEDITASSQWN